MGDGTPCGMNTMMNETPLRPGRAHITQSHHCAGTGRGRGGEGHEGSKGGLLFVTVTLCFSVCSVSPGISGALRGQQGK